MGAAEKIRDRLSLPFETVERSELEALQSRPTQTEYEQVEARNLAIHIEMECLQAEHSDQIESLKQEHDQNIERLKQACWDDINAANEDLANAHSATEELTIENQKLESLVIKLDQVVKKLKEKHESELATQAKEHKSKLQKLNDKLKKAEAAKATHEKNANKWWAQFKEAEKRVTEHEATIKVIQKNTEYVPTFAVIDETGTEWRCYSIHAGVKNDDKASWLTRYFRITTDHPELMHEMGTTVLRETGVVELAQPMPESEVPAVVLERIQNWYRLNKNKHNYEVIA